VNSAAKYEKPLREHRCLEGIDLRQYSEQEVKLEIKRCKRLLKQYERMIFMIALNSGN
jgi:hypothetical protein